MARRYQALIVEDEPLARADLVHAIGRHPEIEVRWQVASVAEATAVLSEATPDLLFLDVMLGDGSGFDLLPMIPASAEIIFVTAYDEHAVRAFEVNALDYLTKPVSEARLAESVRRLLAPAHRTDPGATFRPGDSVFVRSGSQRCFVALDQLLVLSSEGGNYTSMALSGGESLTVRTTLNRWQKRLPATMFVRVHRTTIVNLSGIRRFWHEGGGSYFVQVTGIEEPIRVSRGRVQQLRPLLDAKTVA